MGGQQDTLALLKKEGAQVEDCTDHYLPHSLGVGNILMLAKLFEKQALTLDAPNTSHLSFYPHVWTGEHRTATFSYLYDQEMSSLVHNWFYERMDELQNLLTKREGRLSLLTGTIDFDKEDVDRLFPPKLELDFVAQQMTENQLRTHQAYCHKISLGEAVGLTERVGSKKVM